MNIIGKRCVPACLIVLFMLCVMLPTAALAVDHSTAVSADAAWSDNDTVSGLTISGGTAEEPIVITVTGTVTVNGMITIGPGAHVKFTGGGTLLRGADYLDYLVTVSGGTLTLENITLDGNKGNVSATRALISIISDGSMTMNDGAVLRNNKNTTTTSTNSGGGVRLYSNTGTFTMNGGSITGNESACDGGGVKIHARSTVKSIFIMNGGSITGNSVTGNAGTTNGGTGGGVCIFYSGTFVMHGGVISGNSAEIAGSAIYGSNGSAGPSTLTVSPQADVAIAGSIVGESIVPIAVTPAEGFTIASVTADGTPQSAASDGCYSIGSVSDSLEIVLARDNPPVAGEPWDGETSTPMEETDAAGNAGSGYYRISTGAQLAWLAQQVNAGQSFSGKTVLLTHDIDLGEKEWTPIGSPSITVTPIADPDSEYGDTATLDGTGHSIFDGTFDGAGYEISGLCVSAGNGVALFGYLGSAGGIKDLSVSGTVHGGHFVGGVVAICSGTVEGVTNKVVVSATGNYVGGVAAEGVGTITITDCHNRAFVSNSSNTRSSGKVAGIIGRVDTGSSATITACSNTVPITGYQYVGGIIGGQFGSVDVSYCYNTGNLTGISFGKVYLGGISGKLHDGTISYCYNTGDLYDQHWSAGHVRAIGGIAGCEENHPVGTAISNCYTTGSISIYTGNMIYGTNWIYMLGNISGGNSSTAANTMAYENCYYLENRIAQADPSHADYKFWADVYKANPLLWDTIHITGKTEAEMKDFAFLEGFSAPDYFIEDWDNVNEGYPILYWQSGQAPPEESEYSIETEISGSGSAEVSLSTSSAVAGTTVIVTISELEAGKQVRSVSVTDASGRAVSVTTLDPNTTYIFTMPARNATVRVIIENTVAEGTAYRLTVPSGLDAIWTVSADSTYKTGDQVTEGASVFLTVAKNGDARMTSFEGVTITTASGDVDYSELLYATDSDGSGVSGVYLFTMPAGDVTVSLAIEYAPISVYRKTGDEGPPELLGTYTRDEMIGLAAADPIYYSGYYSETEPFIGKGEQAVTLTALLTATGISFNEGDTLDVGSTDGMNLLFSYDTLYGSQRYYYPNLISGANAAEKAAGATPVDMLLVIKGYMARAAEGSVDSLTCDTLYAYRFVFGQTETEFNNGVPAVQYKAVDKMPKYVSKIVVIKSSGTYSVTADSGISGGSLVLSSTGGAAGDTVIVTVNPDSGKQLVAGSLKYTDDDGATFTEITAAGGVYSFVLPAADVTVTAQFEDISTGDRTPPVLTADTTDNSVGQAVELTFTDDEDWRSAVSGSTVNGTVLTGEQYTVSAGVIHIDAGVFSAAGDYTVTIAASGYRDATVTQTIYGATDYTVTFVSAGATYTTVRVAAETAIEAPAEPAKEGYAFGGWYADEAWTTAVDFPYTVLGDVTFYAKWTAVPRDQPKYTVTPTADEAVYEVGGTPGISTMTVKTGVSGLKYFGARFTPVIAHAGKEAVVFVHLRDGVQLSLNVTRADFDLVGQAKSGFNVQAGDVVKVFIVDNLTNDAGSNPILLQ